MCYISIAAKEPVVDREDTVRRFNLLEITFNGDGSVKSYVVNQKKLDAMLLTAGFFASKTIGVEMDPLYRAYGQDKIEKLRKGIEGRYSKVRQIGARDHGLHGVLSGGAVLQDRYFDVGAQHYAL